jgi:type IV pilus assembly protein PilC
MLSVGLRTGSSDSVIEQIASRMSDEAEQSLAASVARIEPAMVIITAFMVGIIILSVLLPLINIMKTIAAVNGGDRFLMNSYMKQSADQGLRQ